MTVTLLSYEEACERLGLKRDTLTRYVMRREIGHKKIGKFTRFTEAHIQEFLDRCDRPVLQKAGTGRKIRRSPRAKQD